MLTAEQALPLLLAELGDPHLVAVEAPCTHRRLRAAVAEAGVCGLVVLLAEDQAEAVEFGQALQPLPVEVDAIPVAEGVLVVARVLRAGPPSVARPPAWSTPDASPVPDATATDLDDDVLRRVLQGCSSQDRREVTDRGTNEERYLASFGLLAVDGAIWRPTLAALVLVGRRPDLFLPSCTLRGEVDGEPLALPGPLPDIIRGLEALPATRADRHVVLEAVVNAFLHRDWRREGSAELYAAEDRLEVRNPGAVLSRPPNPLALRLATAMGLATNEGRGLRDVATRLNRAGRDPYSLVQQAGTVRFVVDRPRRPAVKLAPGPAAVQTRPPPAPKPPAPEPVDDPPPRPAAPVPVLLPRDPDDRADAVLRLLRERGRCTTREVAAALGCSRPVVGKVLTTLVAEGRVRPVATSSRSPFQVYVAADEAA